MTSPDSSHRRAANTKRPILHIEVKLVDNITDNLLVRTDDIRSSVRKWISDNFLRVKIGQHLNTRTLPCGHFVQSIHITGHSHTNLADSFHNLADNYLDMVVYSLFHGEEDNQNTPQQDDEEGSLQFTTIQLPHKSLDGLWESLIYSDSMPASVLCSLTRMMSISNVPRLNPALICWHNLILFQGPPGSGKTTLAQAVAQKLSIRLALTYSTTKLITVNTHSLLSAYFGQSSKLVGKLFENIWSLSSDDSLLTIVVIDEVESIASSREHSSLSNECGDAIRATNELLQGLDKLRKRSNVIFICTSNLKDNIDSAFLDRCAIKQNIGSPSVECVYEIFRSVLNELIRTDLVSCDSSETPDPAAPYQSTEHKSSLLLPAAASIEFNLPTRLAIARQELQTIAQMAEGRSGRTLRRLPMLALTKYTFDEPCDLSELLDALKRVVKEEEGAQYENQIQVSREDLTPSESDVDEDDGTVSMDGSTGSPKTAH